MEVTLADLVTSARHEVKQMGATEFVVEDTSIEPVHPSCIRRALTSCLSHFIINGALKYRLDTRNKLWSTSANFFHIYNSG